MSQTRFQNGIQLSLNTRSAWLTVATERIDEELIFPSRAGDMENAAFADIKRSHLQAHLRTQRRRIKSRQGGYKNK